MQKQFTESPLQYFRKDRIWLVLNGVLTSTFGIYAAKDLFFLKGDDPIDYVRDSLLFIVMAFAASMYWKSLNMNLVVLFDRIKVKGWWQDIDILFKDIEKCELHSPNYSKSCILHLRKPLPQFFHFSSDLPLIVLEKDRTVIALSSFLREQDWTKFERTVCQKKES